MKSAKRGMILFALAGSDRESPVIDWCDFLA